MQSSTWREIKANSYSPNSVIKCFTNKNLYWQTDNVATTSLICSRSNKVKLQKLAFEIYDFYALSLNIQWIPGKLNKTAQLLIKYIDHDDWFVNDNYFKFTNTKWEPLL